MKTLFSGLIITSIFVLVFASCSKEEPTLPTTTNEPNTVHTDRSGETAPTGTAKVRVTRTVATTVSGETRSVNSIAIDFAANEDFSHAEVDAVQDIAFSDGSKTVMLSLRPLTYAGSYGTLTVEFALDGQDLSGLVLRTAQDIVIEDQIEL